MHQAEIIEARFKNLYAIEKTFGFSIDLCNYQNDTFCLCI